MGWVPSPPVHAFSDFRNFCRAAAKSKLRFMRTKSVTEKRQAKRFPLQLPVALKAENAADGNQTENISSGGVKFYADSNVEIGATVGFTIRMPKDVLGAPQDVLVNCSGRVIRCDRIKRRYAVAVVIDDYDFKRC